jgi:signal transduction histidine kinase
MSILKRFSLTFFPLAGVLAALLGIVYYTEVGNDVKNIMLAERQIVATQKKLITTEINRVLTDLNLMATHQELINYINKPNPEDILRFRNYLQREYAALLRKRQVYDRIRFIEVDGQENIHVAWRGDRQTHIVSTLEDSPSQARQSWFQEGIKLRNDQSMISHLTLKEDANQIARPFEAIVPIVKPVFDFGGQRQGLLVLDYLGRNLFEILQLRIGGDNSNAIIVNNQGYWLWGPNPQTDWEYLLARNREQSMGRAFPQSWKVISSANEGQIQIPSEGIFTFTAVNLNGVDQADNTVIQSEPWILISHVPEQVLRERSLAKFYPTLIVYTAILPALGVIVYQVSLSRLKKETAERQRSQSEAALRQSETQLQKKAADLESALQELRQTQAQLVQNEKMTGLGQLVAGVAHEINNPVNFIHGNLSHAQFYSQELIDLVSLYQSHYPEPPEVIASKLDAVDFSFLEKDLNKLFSSMQLGTQRISQIVKSLQNFSRMDEQGFKLVNVHEGIESTLTILDHRIKELGIEVIQCYGQLPLVECNAGEINQVLMNLLSNALDAIASQPPVHPQITVTTISPNPDTIEICIADNGSGIPASLRSRIFDPFFTTKEIGKGTGLGLAISYKIIVEKHRGDINFYTQEGQGTEFVISIPVKQNLQGKP